MGSSAPAGNHALAAAARKQLKEVGWTKGLELVKIARREGQDAIVQPGFTGHVEMRNEEFKQEVEKELTGRETEP